MSNEKKLYAIPIAIEKLCIKYFSESPRSIERCAVGQGNFVYIVKYPAAKYVVRCSLEQNAYENTIYNLERLAAIGIPVPKVIANGKFENFEYLILSYIKGKDIGLVYPQLTDCDKKAIAKEIVEIQDRVAEVKLEGIRPDWSWFEFIKYMLERSSKRMIENGYFENEKVTRLWEQVKYLESYFASIKPITYLDDISTKNLLIDNGRISGIIDVDWLEVGDKLTYVALTNMALLDLGYDTDYVKYILEEMRITDIEKKAFLFYTLLFCVDFMGERGMTFTGKKIEVNEKIIDKLNGIYDKLWKEWIWLCDKK